MTAADPTVGTTYKCKLGHYCIDSTTAPVPCPAGKFRATVGAEKLTDCTTTTLGYYTAAGAESDTALKCDAGYYCPAGSTGPKAIACPEKKFRGTTGAGALTDCVTCTVGYYCPQATSVPEICPQGYFCLAGVATPS
jgi:hypothetical protein